jgi:hypothetical protein
VIPSCMNVHTLLGGQNGRKRVCVDFDGVIHACTSKWTIPEEIQDDPVPGAIDWLNQMCARFNVVILSARANCPFGAKAIEKWLLYNGLEEEFLEMGFITVTSTKIGAAIYIDDKGFCFTGQFPSGDFIESFRPWNKMTGDGR